MDYLARDQAPFSAELWQRLDSAVAAAARQVMIGRRVVPLYGPLGIGYGAATVESANKEEVYEDGFAVIQGRRVLQLPQLYEDFWIYGRDVAEAERTGVPLDISGASRAAQALAMREDRMIFYGVPALGLDGLLTVKGTVNHKRSDWSKGEGAYTDVAAGVAQLLQNGCYGNHMLVVSSDLYVQLQRIQPGTGELEAKRIRALVAGLYMAPALDAGTALLVCGQPQFVDLAVGQDVSIAYDEFVDLNHHLRALETAILRIKVPGAVVVFK